MLPRERDRGRQGRKDLGELNLTDAGDAAQKLCQAPTLGAAERGCDHGQKQ